MNAFICTRWTSSDERIVYVFIGDSTNSQLQELIEICHQKKKPQLSPSQLKYLKSLRILDGQDVSSARGLRFVRRSVFFDDTVAMCLTKIVRFIHEFYEQHGALNGEFESIMSQPFQTEKDFPVAWTRKTNFVFETDKTWSGWVANPWMLKRSVMSDETLRNITQAPVHKSRLSELARAHHINIVFPSECPQLANPVLRKWYTLWNAETPLATWEQVNTNDRQLSSLWSLPIQHPKLANASDIILVEFNENGSYAFSGSKMELIEIFQNFPIKGSSPFIQWVGDKYHVLYRLLKNHDFTSKEVDNFTQISKASSLSSITCYFKPKGNLFTLRWMIDASGKYFVNCKVQSNNMSLDIVYDSIASIKLFWKSVFSMKFTMQDRAITSKTSIHVSNTIKTAHLFNEFSKFGLIASVQANKMERMKWHFMRSSTYDKQIDSNDFIQSRVMLNERIEDIVQLFYDYFGIKEEVALERIQQYEDFKQSSVVGMGEKKPKHSKYIQMASTVAMSRTHDDIEIRAINFAELDDIQRMVHWVRGIVIKIILDNQPSSSTVPAQRRNVAKKVVHLSDVDDVAPSRSPSISSSRGRSSASNSSDIMARSSSSPLIGGSYDVIKILKQLDQGLFEKTTVAEKKTNYPRLCSANTNQQPIGVTQDEMKRIDESEYKNSYDNKILYGSDKSKTKHNYYFCPRIWCPTSKVPLSPEQLQKLDGKCPGPTFEEPWLLYDANYWGKDASREHYIGFHKSQGTNGLCLPCCKLKKHNDSTWKKCTKHIQDQEGSVKPPVPSAPSPSQSPPPHAEDPSPSPKLPKKRGRKSKTKDPDEKEGYYILHNKAPLEAKRWGDLPENLHNLLSPTKPHSACSSQLTTNTKCFLRTGIKHNKDSLLNALGYIVTNGLGGKRELIAKLMDTLSPLEYITLENGIVLESFLDEHGISPLDQNLVNKWKTWVSQYPQYVRVFSLQNLIASSDARTLSLTKQLQLSRELGIYKSWQRFFLYMKSSEPKTTHLMYDLMRIMNVKLILWEKVKDDEVYLRCPFTLSWNDLYSSLDDELTPYAMVMLENDHYEPIQLQSRGVKGVTLLDDSAIVNTLRQVSSSCMPQARADEPRRAGETTSLNNYVLLHSVPSLAFTDNVFAMKSIVISPKLEILGFLTNENIRLSFKDPMAIHHLATLMRYTGVRKVDHEDDVSHSGRTLLLPSHELGIFMKLKNHLNLDWNITHTKYSDELQKITVAPTNQSTLPTIPIVAENEIDDKYNEIQKEHEHWIRVQQIVGKTLLTQYNRYVKPVLEVSKSARVQALLQAFQLMPDRVKSKIKTILEEIPYERNALYKWYLKIGSNDKLPFYSQDVKSNGHEWIFSQLAVGSASMAGGSLPAHILTPSKAEHVPKLNQVKHVVSVMRPVTITDAKPTDIELKAIPPHTRNATFHSLPEKWTKSKKQGWNDFRIMQIETYDVPMMRKWMDWMALYCHITIPKDFIDIIHQVMILQMITSDSQYMGSYLSDPSVWQGIAKVMGSEGSKQATVTKNFLGLAKDRKWDVFSRYFSSSSNRWLCDLDLLILARLTNSIIVLLHRSSKGDVKKEERGSVSHFLASATIFYDRDLNKTTAQIDRLPLFVFNKKVKLGDSYTIYEFVSFKETEFAFKEVRRAPEPLASFVHELVNAQKET